LFFIAIYDIIVVCLVRKDKLDQVVNFNFICGLLFKTNNGIFRFVHFVSVKLLPLIIIFTNIRLKKKKVVGV